MKKDKEKEPASAPTETSSKTETTFTTTNYNALKNSCQVAFDKDVFCKNLKQVMKDNDVNTTELADILNLCPSYVSHFRVGRQIPRLPTLYMICEFFNVSIDWICGRDR